jgi:Tfp pilus assembly protein PilN
MPHRLPARTYRDYMQQINLYQPMFRKERKRFSALALLQIGLACLLLLAAIGVYFQVHLHRLQASEQSLGSQHQHLEQTLAALRGNGEDPALAAMDTRIAELETRLRERESLLAGIARLATGRNGFAPLLRALSQQRVPGLWLTGVHFEAGGREVQLRGVALEDGLVPRYLEILPEHEQLQALDFQQVQLQRRQSEDPGLDFTLRTQGLALSGGGQ